MKLLKTLICPLVAVIMMVGSDLGASLVAVEPELPLTPGVAGPRDMVVRLVRNAWISLPSTYARSPVNDCLGVGTIEFVGSSIAVVSRSQCCPLPKEIDMSKVLGLYTGVLIKGFDWNLPEELFGRHLVDLDAGDFSIEGGMSIILRNVTAVVEVVDEPGHPNKPYVLSISAAGGWEVKGDVDGTQKAAMLARINGFYTAHPEKRAERQRLIEEYKAGGLMYKKLHRDEISLRQKLQDAMEVIATANDINKNLWNLYEATKSFLEPSHHEMRNEIASLNEKMKDVACQIERLSRRLRDRTEFPEGW